MSFDALDPVAQRWFSRRTLSGPFRSPELLGEIKAEGNISVSVCLPTLNEAGTVGEICRVIRSELIEKWGLVDELIVVDSGSTDATLEVAEAEGAKTFSTTSLIPEVPAEGGGKGDALWRSLAAVQGSIVVWLDADVRNFEPHFVTRLLEPLLMEPEIVLAKGFYERPAGDAGGPAASGGRVTELVVRPLLNLFYPELAGFIQPLAGEYAGRTKALRQLPFFTGYGVEIGLLLDATTRFGIDALAQVDLGTRIHRNRSTLELGRTSLEVMHVMFTRLEDVGRLKLSDPLRDELVQFWPDGRGSTPHSVRSPTEELPPLDLDR